MGNKIIKITQKEERARHFKYAAIMSRATAMNLMKEGENVERIMDIESADKKFNMRLDEWLGADEINFAHDFIGIRDNIVRDDFPATDFGYFIPRFAGDN